MYSRARAASDKSSTSGRSKGVLGAGVEARMCTRVFLVDREGTIEGSGRSRISCISWNICGGDLCGAVDFNATRSLFAGGDALLVSIPAKSNELIGQFSSSRQLPARMRLKQGNIAAGVDLRLLSSSPQTAIELSYRCPRSCSRTEGPGLVPVAFMSGGVSISIFLLLCLCVCIYRFRRRTQSTCNNIL